MGKIFGVICDIKANIVNGKVVVFDGKCVTIEQVQIITQFM